MLDKFKNKLLFSILFSIAIFVALSIYADINDMITAFCSFQWIYIPLILFLAFLNYIFRFFKWDYYLNCIGINIKKKDSLVIFFSGLTMSVTPAKLGEVFKSYLLKELNDTGMSKSVPIVFAERATDIIGLVILASIGFSAFGYGKEVLLIVMAFILFVIVIIQSKNICLRMIDYAGRISFVSKYAKNLYTLYESAYTLFSLKNVLIAVLISVISWFFVCIELFVILKGFGVDVSLLTSMFIFSFSTIAGAVSMIPGGLGVIEGCMTGLLVMDGTPKAITVGAILINDFCTLWFGVFVGLITLSLFSFSKKIRKVKSVNGHFDEIAEEYKEQIPEHIRLHFLNKKAMIMDRILSKSGLDKKKSIGLDLGCGLGWYVQKMNEIGYNEIGMDYSSNAVKIAKKEIHSSYFITGSAEKLPFKNESLDFVYSINMFHHLSGRMQKTAFNEVERVLKPNGYFFLHEINIYNPIFKLYMNYIFPRTKKIDTGDEEWIHAKKVYELSNLKVVGISCFTFIPDFTPKIIFLRILKIEAFLEKTWFRKYGIHYMATLKNIKKTKTLKG